MPVVPSLSGADERIKLSDSAELADLEPRALKKEEHALESRRRGASWESPAIREGAIEVARRDALMRERSRRRLAGTGAAAARDPSAPSRPKSQLRSTRRQQPK